MAKHSKDFALFFKSGVYYCCQVKDGVCFVRTVVPRFDGEYNS